MQLLSVGIISCKTLKCSRKCNIAFEAQRVDKRDKNGPTDITQSFSVRDTPSCNHLAFPGLRHPLPQSFKSLQLGFNRKIPYRKIFPRLIKKTKSYQIHRHSSPNGAFLCCSSNLIYNSSYAVVRVTQYISIRVTQYISIMYETISVKRRVSILITSQCTTVGSQDTTITERF